MRKKHRRSERTGFFERLSKNLDISPDIFSGNMVEIRGQSSMTVHGCTEILLYTTETVRLLMHGCELEITGRDLYCTAYHTGVVEIDGTVEAVVYGKNGKNGRNGGRGDANGDIS